MRRSIALLALIASVSSAHAQPAAESELPEYCPLKVGTAWHYRIEADGQVGTATQRVTKLEKFGKKILARTEGVASTAKIGSLTVTPSYGHISSNTKGVFTHRQKGVEYSPPICNLKYPVKKGETWECETTYGGTEAKVKFKVVSTDTVVEVPAGRFPAVVVTMEMGEGIERTKTTTWFAPNVGPVRHEIEDSEGTVLIQLTKFTPGR